MRILFGSCLNAQFWQRNQARAIPIAVYLLTHTCALAGWLRAIAYTVLYMRPLNKTVIHKQRYAIVLTNAFLQHKHSVNLYTSASNIKRIVWLNKIASCLPCVCERVSLFGYLYMCGTTLIWIKAKFRISKPSSSGPRQGKIDVNISEDEIERIRRK